MQNVTYGSLNTLIILPLRERKGKRFPLSYRVNVTKKMPQTSQKNQQHVGSRLKRNQTNNHGNDYTWRIVTGRRIPPYCLHKTREEYLYSVFVNACQKRSII